MVLALRSSAVAISLFDLPSTIICNTSSSRCGRAALRSPFKTERCSTLGSNTVSPAATLRIAAPSSRSIAFLRTYPLAPASIACRTHVFSECMLSMRTAVSGVSFMICRVACRPFMPGRAQSITPPWGLSFLAILMDSSPVPASPTTSMSDSSSSMRRKPRRTRLWSSTSNTAIFFSIRLRFLPGDGQMHPGSTFHWARKNDLPAHQFRALAHRNQTNPVPVGMLRETDSMIFYFQLKNIRKETQTHPRLLGPGVPRHVVQRFLHNAVNMHPGAPVHRKSRTLLLIGYGNPGLTFYGRNVPVERALEPGLVQHHGMQRLRQAANALQSTLHDLENFLQVRSQRRALGRVRPCAPQHRAYRSENLSKLVMQFA